ncbi:GFA family protein [Vitiosangium sp. GDMCC 1.1324]|uniref:GFA family protein n=1 Tax=Vitiosangium sp. (strain GDMCC 1.1324) TaxID=2138576 RepID=UPI000D3C9158|nr:GFA family protein [Vitiosangium sp. GDMCC 1.1324]PTL77734.1 aldehyde-activating protein [Vitiosangium sp. GDMCC 1.1324]
MARIGEPTVALRTYSGSCHCGAVRFQADIDLSEGTNKCNCSHCTKARTWFTFVKPERLRLIAGADAHTDYRWTPPGRPGPLLHHQFCKTCGVRTFGWGEHESMGGKFYFVAVASLDDVDPDELAAAPIKYADGRHDRFDQPPKDTRLL